MQSGDGTRIECAPFLRFIRPLGENPVLLQYAHAIAPALSSLWRRGGQFLALTHYRKRNREVCCTGVGELDDAQVPNLQEQ